MLFLNSKDIESCLVRNELMNQMEEAMSLFEANQLNMPPRTHVTDRENALLFMPCFGKEYFCTKLVSVFPGNEGTEHPVVNGIVILNDAKTGVPVAILDGQTLTGIRTGAVGGLGVRHFSSLGSDTAGIVGSGVQGFHQILFACTAYLELNGKPIRRVYIHNRNSRKVQGFIASLESATDNTELEGTEFIHATSVEELLEASQTVILATSSEQPVLPDKPELLEGKCIVAIGSYRPDMQEIPRSAFEIADRMFLDTSHAAHESGDVINPLKHGWINRDKVQSLGDFLIKNKNFHNFCHPEFTEKKETLKEEETGHLDTSDNSHSSDEVLRGKNIIYKSVGMAAFDMMAAVYIFNRAKKCNTGRQL